MTERAIFEAAAEIRDRARRASFLNQACEGDAALRRRIEALLSSHENASQFLNVPVVEQLQPPVVDPNVADVNSATVTLPVSPVSEQPNDRREGDSDDELSVAPDLSFLQPSSKPGSIGTLGHYEILKILGQGGFGIVFKAFDETLHRHVAIKTMSPQIAATSPPRKRFLREARSAAAIKHENIVQVYSVEEQPLPYLVMEFIDGQMLQERQRSYGPLEVTELLHFAKQIASGLASAHAQGLIHRDIKPANILLENGADQKVKITDFGLARAADDASLTRSGMISGTPMYMAPEQALGQPLDHRSDLFSLGSVLYELASDRPPTRWPRSCRPPCCSIISANLLLHTRSTPPSPNSPAHPTSAGTPRRAKWVKPWSAWLARGSFWSAKPTAMPAKSDDPSLRSRRHPARHSGRCKSSSAASKQTCVTSIADFT